MSTEESNALVVLKTELPQIEAILGLHTKPGQNVALLAKSEIGYLEALSLTMPAIKKCEPISVLLAVKTVLKQNLTLDPYAGLTYTKTRNVNKGTKEKPDYVTVLEIMPSCNGLISIARQCGTILDIMRPKVEKDTNGKVVGVKVNIQKPGVPAPRWEEYDFDESDFVRWQTASHKENGRGKNDANAETLNYSNKNYTSHKGGIDPEFARAKAIRHALKKLGTNQNEARSGGMKIIPKDPIVDISADKEATNDEPNITDASVISETKPVNGSDDLPNSNDL